MPLKYKKHGFKYLEEITKLKDLLWTALNEK